ncbi:TOBE domain-containing protein, partial [bacterium]|nr:TOBE domain-containing protein [bacterium]
LGGGISLAAPFGGAGPGAELDVGFYADEVLLCLERPAGLSARNVLPGEVRALDAVGHEVLLTLRVGDVAIRARLTPGAVRELDLHEGVRVHVIIKTTSIHRLN